MNDGEPDRRRNSKGALAADAVTVSVYVEVSPADAFDVFTRETDAWWGTGRRYRIAGRRRGQICFEPGLGGRLFETFVVGAGTRTFEVGKVTAWQPPERLAFEWRGVNFAPGETTFVDVSFEPSGEGTLVTLRHHGWSALPSAHPVRHGRTDAAFIRTLGMWWAGLMTSLREHVATRR